MTLLHPRFRLHGVPHTERSASMARWKSSRRTVRLVMAGALMGVGASLIAPRPAMAAGSLVRTMVYHEITAFPSTLPNMDEVLSGSGERAVFAQAPGPEP